jgi:hypothetical protein
MIVVTANVIQIVHVTADGFSHMFALVGGMLGVTVIGSFHTDLMDLLSTHNAAAFQLFCVNLKERLDSVVLDSCATTSTSFMVRNTIQHSMLYTIQQHRR